MSEQLALTEVHTLGPFHTKGAANVHLGAHLNHIGHRHARTVDAKRLDPPLRQRLDRGWVEGERPTEIIGAGDAPGRIDHDLNVDDVGFADTGGPDSGNQFDEPRRLPP